jgi:type IV pilus assembly protein PilC
MVANIIRTMTTNITKSNSSNSHRPSLKELEVFTQQLALMTRAGVPIVTALTLIKGQALSSHQRDVLGALINTIIDGGSISHGMALHSAYFPQFYVTLVAAGERAGILEQALEALANELSSRRILSGRLIRAAIYPAFIIVTLCAVVTFLLICVVPTFADLFAENGVALPWLTQKILSLSQLIANASMLVPTFILLVILSLAWGSKHSKLVSDTFMRISIRAPLMHKLIKAKLAYQVSSLLGSLTRVGIPIIEALTIVSETTQNPLATQEIARIRSEIIDGHSLSTAFRNSHIFPNLVSNLIEVGESSGQLDNMLSNIASIYREDLNQACDLLKQLVEPILILLIGLVVGTAVLAIYLPIFQIGDLAGTASVSQTLSSSK